MIKIRLIPSTIHGLILLILTVVFATANEESLVSKMLHSNEPEKYVGLHITFEGDVIDPFKANSKPFERPNPLRVEIIEKGKKSNIFAIIELSERDIQSVARFPAAQILIKVDGVIQSIDVKHKTIYIKSLNSSVIASN